MAGDVEEPFRLSFQAEPWHSGSISFGRFEVDSLSWERRSSFSHNRYLEEAEKISRPGSVMEKAAYLEAHFKKQALLRQASSESQNERGCESNGNHIEQTRSEAENDTESRSSGEEHGHANEVGECRDSSYCQGDFDNIECEVQDTGFTQFESRNIESAPNDGYSIGHFDKTLDGSYHHEDFDEVQAEEETIDDLLSKSQMESVTCKLEPVENVGHYSGSEKTCETGSSCVEFSLAKTGPKRKVEGNSDNGAPVTTLYPGGDTNINSVNPQNHSPKGVDGTEDSKLRSRSVGNTPLVYRTEATKGAVEKSGMRERQSPFRIRAEKHRLQSSDPASQPMMRKLEICASAKAKTFKDKICEKEPKAKKAIDLQPSTPERRESRLHQSATQRMRHIVSATKKEKPTLSFDSRNRDQAGKTRELKERKHAKEAERTRIEARTLENKEAERRQLQRRLNFKAKPLPSFHNEALISGSNGRKAIPSTGKPTKLQSKSLNFDSKTGRGISTIKSTGMTNVGQNCNLCETAASHRFSPTPSRMRNQTPNARMRNDIASKEPGKETGIQKRRGAEYNKTKVVGNVEKILKIGSGNSNGMLIRKNTKGISFGHGPTTAGHKTVGVAS